MLNEGKGQVWVCLLGGGVVSGVEARGGRIGKKQARRKQFRKAYAPLRRGVKVRCRASTLPNKREGKGGGEGKVKRSA